MTRTAIPLALGGAALFALTACGTSTPSTTAAPAPGTAAAPTAAPPTTATAPAAAPTATAPASWTMPNLVGRNLQDAQNAIQHLTGYAITITTSHDATGAGRRQVSDRNWTVCDQSVAPGATITAGTPIDFGAAKLDESC